MSRLSMLLTAVLAIAHGGTLHAQVYESVGTRAQGMAGAFVAVADDATATWWNPAGLATGAMASLVLERGRTTEPADHPPEGPAWRSTEAGFSFAYPALGLSYYRLKVGEMIVPESTDGAGADRQENVTPPIVRAMAISRYSAALVQSVGEHFAVASTLSLVRAGQAHSAGAGGMDGLAHAEDMDVPTQTRGNLDVGVMASLGTLRLGFSARNLREPEFGEGAERLTLRRQARFGAALAPVSRVVVAAFDADLTRTPTAVGEVRYVAAGVEGWLFRRRLGLRGGISMNTVGLKGRALSGGVSLSVGGGVCFEGALTAGSDRAREGWAGGLALRF